MKTTKSSIIFLLPTVHYIPSGCFSSALLHIWEKISCKENLKGGSFLDASSKGVFSQASNEIISLRYASHVSKALLVLEKWLPIHALASPSSRANLHQCVSDPPTVGYCEGYDFLRLLRKGCQQRPPTHDTLGPYNLFKSLVHLLCHAWVCADTGCPKKVYIHSVYFRY